MINNNVAKKPMTNREIGLQALCDALGPVGMAEFIMGNHPGSGDYTAEKQSRTPMTFEEIEERIKKMHENK